MTLTPDILTYWRDQGWTWQQIGAYAETVLAGQRDGLKAPWASAEKAAQELAPPAEGKRATGPTVRNVHHVWEAYLEALGDRVVVVPMLTRDRAKDIQALFKLWAKYGDDPLESILYQIQGALSQSPGLERFGANAKRTDPEWVFGGKITRCRGLRDVGLVVETLE